MDADEVGLGTSEVGIELGIERIVFFESKAIVDTMPSNNGVGIFTLILVNVRESVMKMVDVRVRVKSMTDDKRGRVNSIWFF